MVTPEKGLVGLSWWYGTWTLLNVWMERTLSPAPPSLGVFGDEYVADDGRAEHWEGTGCGHALELVGGVEGDGVLGPPKRACCPELGEGCIHLTCKLLEDAMGGWGLGAA